MMELGLNQRLRQDVEGEKKDYRRKNTKAENSEGKKGECGSNMKRVASSNYENADPTRECAKNTCRREILELCPLLQDLRKGVQNARH